METICVNDINWLSEFNIINLKENYDLIGKEILPEALTTNCFSCGEKFKFFLAPSYRCIICLKIFCSSCINKLKIKICKNCYKLCQKYNKILENILIKKTDNKTATIELREKYFCEEFENYDSKWRNFFNNEKNSFEKQLLVDNNTIYELLIKTLINYVLTINLKDEKIVKEWKDIIYKLLKEVIDNLHPSSRYLNDSLDINKYIKIKIIPYKDTSLCKVIKGYVLHRKKKQSNIKDNFEYPRILLLNNDIIKNDNDNDNDNENDNNNNNKEKDNSNNKVISNSKEEQLYLLKYIDSKINKIKPDIIIIGKDFPEYIIDIMINNNNYNISLIYDINSSVFIKLARCFQSLILPSIKLIGNNNFLGTCEKFYIQKYLDNKINKENNNDKQNINNNKNTDNNIINNNKNDENINDLYIFDGCNKLLFNTIILSGNDINILKIIKKLMRQILLPSIRDLYLQKYIQYIFNMEINQPTQDLNSESDYIKRLYEESNEITPLKKDDTCCNENNLEKNKEKKSSKEETSSSTINQNNNLEELFYEGFDLSIIEKKEDFSIYSLISLTSFQKNKNEIKNNLKEEKDEEISEKEIHNIVNKYCGDGKELHLSFFNGDENYDQTLGKFILNLCQKSKSICQICNIEYSKHTQYLYRAKSVLKYWMISGNENDLDKVINFLKKRKNIDYSKLLSFKNENYSFNEIINADIYTYGYCRKCKGIVTRLFKFNNEVFNYSSTKFLKYMLENHFTRNQKRNFKYNISDIVINAQCNHYINKDISRIFVTRYGSWIFEYNDIIKHYISPMNLNINYFSNGIELFKKYEDEGYTNSINIQNLIQKILCTQRQFFEELYKNEKLAIFNEFIKAILQIVQGMESFNGKYMTEIINKYLKNNNDKYNNCYIRLIAHMKKIYFKIVQIKLILNKIERLKINLKVISDIIDNKIPITLEENNKLSDNQSKDSKLEAPSSEIDFGKNTYFRNILNFLKYSDNKHDYYSSEFIQDDLTSFISNALSSNEYIKSLKSKNGLNLSLIKCKRNSNEMVSDIITNNILTIKKVSSFKQIKKNNNVSIEANTNDNKNLDESENENENENKDSKDSFDTMLVFDQSKQHFYVEGEKGGKYYNNLLKKILEEEIKSDEIENKTYYLNNDLYSILIKKKKKGDGKKIQMQKTSSNDNFSDLNLSNDNSNNNIDKANSNESLENINDVSNKNESYESEKMNFTKTSKKDFKKITLYLKDIEIQIIELNVKFKELRDKLINIIKNKIDKSKEKRKESNEIKEETKEEEIKKETREEIILELEDDIKEVNENNEDNSDNMNKKPINFEINEKNDDNNENNNSNHDNNNYDKNNEYNNNDTNSDKLIEKEKDKIDEENIPFFPNIPEFEKITKAKMGIYFEEKFILKEPNSIEIIVYFQKQFEALRTSYCANLEDFLISLSKSSEWGENTGGKSKSSFFKTADEKYILKNVSEIEFNMFLEIAREYFNYISQFLFHKMPSVLAKILGAYKITTKQNNKEIKYHLILMENIYYGMMSKTNKEFNSPKSNLRVYDLKGSNINRYINKNMRKPGQVLLDTNFLVDFNKEPVNIDSNVYGQLKKALQNDTIYLKSLGVVDYSLLFIFDNKANEDKQEEVSENVYYDYETQNFFYENNHKMIKLGIIDYLRKYTWDKKMEFYGKSIIYRENPTIVDPNVYCDRFYKKIISYFVGV